MTFRENMLALSSLPRFFRLIWATHKGFTIANVVLRLLQSLVPVITLYIGKLIIDEVVRLSAGGTDASLLWEYVLAELLITLFSAGLSRAITLIDALLGDLFANESSLDLMEHANQLDLSQFEDSEFYDKLERARRQTVGRVVLLSQIFTQAQDMVTIFFLATGLVVFSPWLIVLLILAVIPAFLSETYFNQRSYSLARNWTPERRELDYIRFIAAADNTAKEIKIFGLSDYLKEQFSKLADKYYFANRRLAIRRAAWGLAFNSLGDLGYYVAYIVLLVQTLGQADSFFGINIPIGEQRMSIGDLTFAAGSFARLRGLLSGALSRFSSIAQNALYLQDFFEFLAMKPKIASPPNPVPLPDTIREGFVFEGVGFKYPSTNIFAVRNLSFTLKAGEKLALVGENGAGKTTLVKLLARLYDPDEGRILLDGTDIRDFDVKAYRAAIGVIFQDFVRFQFSAKENIAVGRIEERENQPRIQQSARQSLADSIIESLPEGYEQRLGNKFEKGVELSGGQWQKIALGRAYMREARLLILDEPTAALDARAEYEVFQRFSELTQGKSAVLISHRFSTVRMADRILVLDKGQMVEMGSHEELLAQKGMYAELFTLQAEGYK